MRLLSVETRNHWRTDSGLEEVDDHEGECVGGEGLEPRLVDLVLLGPELDRQHQGADPGVQLGVAVEEVGVPHTKYIRRQLRFGRNILPSPVNVVNTEIHVNAGVSGPSCPELEN